MSDFKGSKNIYCVLDKATNGFLFETIFVADDLVNFRRAMRELFASEKPPTNVWRNVFLYPQDFSLVQLGAVLCYAPSATDSPSLVFSTDTAAIALQSALQFKEFECFKVSKDEGR